MRLFVPLFCLALLLGSCGPSAEELEKERLKDIKESEGERQTAIDGADDFVFGPQEDSTDMAEEIPVE